MWNFDKIITKYYIHENEIEKFKGAKVEGASGVSDYASTGYAASKEFAAAARYYSRRGQSDVCSRH